MTTCSANDLKETALRARNMATTANIHLVGRVWGQSLRGKDKAKDKGPRGNDLTFFFLLPPYRVNASTKVKAINETRPRCPKA